MAMDFDESDSRLGPEAGSTTSRRSGEQQQRSGNRRSLAAMGPEAAGRLLTEFLGGFPHLGVHDPAAYVAVLKATFSEYPEWAGRDACRTLKLIDPDKVPSEGRARKALENAVHFERSAQEFDRSRALPRPEPHQSVGGSFLYPLRVRPGRPGYEAMIERSKSAPAGSFEWAPDGSIWVPLEWYTAIRPGAQMVGTR